MLKFGFVLTVCGLFASSAYAQNASRTGLYVTGGTGFVFSGETDSTDRNCGNTVQLPCGFAATERNDAFVGVFAGAGYRFNPWLRGELRYFTGSTHVTGRVEQTVPAQGVFPTSDYSNYRVETLMGVGFIDLAGLMAPGYFGNFEPYVGAGVGGARNTVTDVRYAPDILGGTQILLPGGSTTNTAWMVTVGTGYRLPSVGSLGVVLDVGYVYADFGEVHTDAGPARSNPPGIAFQSNGFTSHSRGQSLNTALRFEF